MAEAQHRFMPKGFFPALNPSSQFSGGGLLMVMRKAPQRGEEADFIAGFCGEMGVLTKLRTAWKGKKE